MWRNHIRNSTICGFDIDCDCERAIFVRDEFGQAEDEIDFNECHLPEVVEVASFWECGEGQWKYREPDVQWQWKVSSIPWSHQDTQNPLYHFRFVTNMLNIHLIWSGPLIILISAIMLSNLLGILPALSGMIIMALVIPSNLYIGNKLKALQKDQMLRKDERIKFIHETIEGIKLIKLYAWEEAFKEQIGKVREEELNIVKKSVIFAALSYISWILVPFFVALASFTVFVLMNSHTRPLTIDLIFVGISLFSLMKYPLQMFPTVITGLIEAWESLKRIDHFLISKEFDNSNGKSDDDSCCWAVKITDGNFKWNLSSQNNTLKNINVRLKKGSLAIIIGNTAQGSVFLFIFL